MIIPCQVFKKTANNSSYLIWGILEYRAFWVKKENVKRIDWNSLGMTPLTPAFLGLKVEYWITESSQ